MDDAIPDMGNWDEWEAFMASDQATKEVDPEDAADAADLFSTSVVTIAPALSNMQSPAHCICIASATQQRVCDIP